MQYARLFNKILMMPFEQALKLFQEYNENVGFKTFAEQQRVLDMLARKNNIKERLRPEILQEVAIAYTFMSQRKDYMSNCAFMDIKKYPMVVWIEALRFLRPDDIMDLLNNYHDEFTSNLIVMFIANLSEDLQLEAIGKYHSDIDVDDEMLDSLYFSVGDEARKKLREYYPDSFGSDILLKAEDLSEDGVISLLLENKNEVLKLDADSFIRLILLKITKSSNFEVIINNFNELIDTCSADIFELFFTRYKYLITYRYMDDDECYYDSDDERRHFEDLELFNLFKNKFHQLGITRTLSLFDNKEYYGINEFSAEVILSLIDIAYRDCDVSQYINEETFEEMIKRFSKKCRDNNYTLEEFEKLVKKIECDGREKLIFDDYIEAIIACGKLLKEKTIDDKNPLFIELREKFSNDLSSRVMKDGTYTGDVSLNGIFYRLAKGSMPFEKVYMTKNYKGLVYLTKCGQLIDNADYITNFLTDEQLVKLNISPVIKWKNAVKRKNDGADNLSFVERMGLQLLCYFGKDKGKYLLESDMQGNLMENLFDGLNYSEISINEDGTPSINEELINFLFGFGMMREPNSVINKMIRGEILEFRAYFTEFCNEYYNVKTACNGVLSVKRIIKHFENVDLPIDLKPDEIGFKEALVEMNTTNEEKLREAIWLCKDARDREFSTIPKVSGKRGDFRYEILDLDDPLAVAVGNLSHCCFVVRGISYSALKHSMRSKNGRTFVVYYNDRFLTQSWVWRNGDVICFDSVEAGSPIRGMYTDDIKLVDVYREAAEKMIAISKRNEDDIQRVKVVTVGKSDYTFGDLTSFEGNAPTPLEEDVYVYDSRAQRELAGSKPEKIRYGAVGAQYYDERRKPIIIDDVSKTSIDKLDEVVLNVNDLRYRTTGIEEPLDFANYLKIYSGDGWYILTDLDGNIESGKVKKDPDTEEEFDKYLKRIGDSENINSKSLVKVLTSTDKFRR